MFLSWNFARQKSQKMQKKDSEIKIRLEKSEKEEWQKFCKEQGITLTSLIVNSVRKRTWDSERRKAMAFIEKQVNLFAKVENNINQLAKYVNGQKFMTPQQANEFEVYLKAVKKLKQEQNEILMKTYHFIANDSENFKFGE